MSESLWTVTELAAFLGYRPATVATLVSRHPDKLPPRVAALSKPRWDGAAVRAWCAAQSAAPVPVVRRGRRRVES